VDSGNAVRTRSDLERLLDEYEQALASPAYSESTKRTIRADADAVRGRLRDGDFRVGDRVVLYVEGEPDLPDTVQVQPGPSIALPVFGEIPLNGVLRSEISAHLTKELSRFIRDPIVRANGLMRLSVQGAVSRPGFYTIPAEMLVGEALMVAGGPGPQANMDGISIERGAQTLLEGDPLQEAIRQGLTLDQLNLQAGDQIVVPQSVPGGSFIRNLGIVAGVVGSITTIILIFTR
jgi:polysaccharide export outer membrane protein